MLEVTHAINQDLIEGKAQNLVGETDSPLMLLEADARAELEAETEVGAEVEVDAEAEAEAEMEAEADAEVDAEAEAEVAPAPSSPTPAPPINGVPPQAPITQQLKFPIEANGTASYVPAGFNQTSVEPRREHKRRSQWRNRRRYAGTDADLDHVDEVDLKDEDPQADLDRIMADPEIQIYDSDKDRGVKFTLNKSKTAKRRRFLKLQRKLRKSRKETREIYKRRHAVRVVGNGTLYGNGTINTNATLPLATPVVPNAAAVPIPAPAL